MRRELHATIGIRSKEQEKEFDEGIKGESLDNFWKLLSEALENGYLEVLAGTTEIDKVNGMGGHNDC